MTAGKRHDPVKPTLAARSKYSIGNARIRSLDIYILMKTLGSFIDWLESAVQLCPYRGKVPEIK